MPSQSRRGSAAAGASRAALSDDEQRAVLRRLESLSKDEQINVLRTALERRLGQHDQVRPARLTGGQWQMKRRIVAWFEVP